MPLVDNATALSNTTTTPFDWVNNTNITTTKPIPSFDDDYEDLDDDITESLNFAFECVTMPIIVAFGVTGNIISLIVLSNKKLRNSPTSILLIGLAISDCLFLITTMARKSTCIMSRFDSIMSYKYFVYTFNPLFYTNVCFSRISSFLITVISIERLVAVVLPFKVKAIFSPKRVIVAVVSIFVFTFAFLSLLPVQYIIKEIRGFPVLSFSNFYLSHTDLIEVYSKYIAVSITRWLPKVIVVTCNIVVIVFLWKRRRPSKNYESDSKAARQTNYQRRNTIMLVTVAIVFVITMLPGDAFWITRIIFPEFNLSRKYNNYYQAFSDVSLICETINASVNFIIYIVLNSTFSDIYFNMFCRCLSKKKQYAENRNENKKNLAFNDNDKDTTGTISNDAKPNSGNFDVDNSASSYLSKKGQVHKIKLYSIADVLTMDLN